MSVATIVRSWMGEVYLASCVRTPLGRMNGALREVTASRLGAIAIDSVLQRSAVDKSNVDHLCMEVDEKAVPEMLSNAGFPDTTKYSIACGLKGLTSLSSCIDKLSQGLNVTICGGISTLNEKDSEECLQHMKQDSAATLALKQKCSKSFKEALTNGFFLQEIESIQIPGHPRLKRNSVSISEDEMDDTDIDIELRDPMHSTGAAVCLLSSKEFTNTIKLSPLVKVSSFVETASGHLSVASLLEVNKLSIFDINLWQINDITFDVYRGPVKELGIDEALVNIHGGSPALRFSGIQDLIHLTYLLKAHQKGIVVHSNGQSSLSVLIEKLPVCANFISPEKKPILTLFTKDPCPLCDELKLELEPYLDQVHLEQVFLTPESYWYKLYRYEIPVLFLGGRYVCRNKFNVRLFERMLKSIEEELLQ